MQLLTLRTLLTPLSTIIGTFLLTACSGSSGGGGAPAPDLATLEVPSDTEVTRTDVDALLGTAPTITSCKPVGLTITPDTEQLVLLDAMLGVYVLQEDRTFAQAISNQQLHEQVSAFEFTDIAAVGSNQFAITATGDGFLLDLNARTLRQHFCYVPGGLINPTQFTQHTDSVAFDTTTGRILAQPITYMLASGAIVGSQVGTFPITGGEGTDWHTIPETEFLAGAITCDGNGTLWLVRGNDLYTYDLDTDTLTLEQSLARFSVTNVVGMVFVGDDLMLLDGDTRDIVCVPAALL
tara:strand:- start:8155 stop:9036 length:882 start_codon:yes stop_codon:yes gene_type:complete